MDFKNAIVKLLCKLFPWILYSTRSYSQDGEDMILKDLILKKKNYKGFYIDIGAHHPYKYSNTAYFYRKGWRGINIEPTPSLMNPFYKYRKRDVNLNVGVSDTNSKITFFEFNEPALNSFDRTLSLERNEGPYKIINKRNIQVIPLKDVLSEHMRKDQKIDFMNIDVEGLDLKVLQSNDWTKYLPAYILVEGAFDAQNLTADKIYEFLTDKNYVLIARTQRTSIFQYKSL